MWWGGNLTVCQRVVLSGVPPDEIFICGDGKKVISDIIHHNETTIYASVIYWTPLEVVEHG